MKEQNNFDFSKEPGKFVSKRERFNSGEPLISIITPYYNADKYINQTAVSILNQTFPFWEWIIVNDGSTMANTEEVLKEIRDMDSRIKIFNIKIVDQQQLDSLGYRSLILMLFLLRCR